LLEQIGKQLAKEYRIQYMAIEADLAEERSIEKIKKATDHVDVGLLISNAGTGRPGKFLSFDEDALNYILQLNAISHLRLAHHFSKRFAKRGKGGLLLTGAMGSSNGVPYMANEAGTKGYVLSLGKSLHAELKEAGVNVTVLITSPTETPILAKLGFNKENTPMKPISVEQCVREALRALTLNQITILPGRIYRVMNALIPGAVARKMMGDLMKRNNKIV
jgi:short-subunit dehydrogenase